MNKGFISFFCMNIHMDLRKFMVDNGTFVSSNQCQWILFDIQKNKRRKIKRGFTKQHENISLIFNGLALKTGF